MKNTLYGIKVNEGLLNVFDQVPENCIHFSHLTYKGTTREILKKINE